MPRCLEQYLEGLDDDHPKDQCDVELLRERLRLRLLEGVILVDHPADHGQRGDHDEDFG